MIEQGLDIREEFKDKVKIFCSLHGVEWSDNIYKSVTGGIIGEADNVSKVMEYINDLDRYRLKKKGLLLKTIYLLKRI
jgi:hypothetical protein